MYIIHLSSNKNIVYVWRGIKANFYRDGTAHPHPPLRFEIPGSAPDNIDSRFNTRQTEERNMIEGIDQCIYT